MMLDVPGFAQNQSSLNPVGPGAAHIEHEFALIFWITMGIYVLVILFLVVTVARKRHSLDTIPDPIPTTEQATAPRGARWRRRWS